jgi:hypothetical protein
MFVLVSIGCLGGTAEVRAQQIDPGDIEKYAGKILFTSEKSFKSLPGQPLDPAWLGTRFSADRYLFGFAVFPYTVLDIKDGFTYDVYVDGKLTERVSFDHFIVPDAQLKVNALWIEFIPPAQKAKNVYEAFNLSSILLKRACPGVHEVRLELTPKKKLPKPAGSFTFDCGSRGLLKETVSVLDQRYKKTVAAEKKATEGANRISKILPIEGNGEVYNFEGAYIGSLGANSKSITAYHADGRVAGVIEWTGNQFAVTNQGGYNLVAYIDPDGTLKTPSGERVRKVRSANEVARMFFFRNAR